MRVCDVRSGSTEPASKALEPHIDAMFAEQARIAEECAARKQSEAWDAAAIGRWRTEELPRANAPFEHFADAR